jgi:hypothetical protein
VAALTLANLNDVAKEVYRPSRLKSLALAKRPLLNWLSKTEKMGGQGYVVPVWYENPQSVGASLSAVITNQENTRQERFFVSDDEFCAMYGVVAIEGKALLGTRSDMMSYLKAKDMQVQGMVSQLGKRLHESLYGDGNGYLARIGSITNANPAVITFTNKSDVNFFGIGQELVADDTATGASPRDSGASYGVTKVDRSAGTVTLDANAVTTSSWAADDYLFIEGDDGTTYAKVTGLAGWLPLSSPSSSDSFFTVNRSLHATRLAGHRIDSSGQEIKQSLHQLVTRIAEGEAGNPDTIFIHPLAGDVLADQLGAKAETLKYGQKGEMEFSGFRLNHFICGPMDFIYDYACPVNRAYVLRKDTWELLHMGDLPHLVQDDGNIALRGSTTDDIQIRGRWFAQLVCNNPGANGVCSISI